MDRADEHSEGATGENLAQEQTDSITIHVHPTTGGQFDIEISPDETAEELRRKISRRLQIPKERLKFLFKDQVLEARPLKDYKISNGSKVTLLPSVESGFSSTVQGTQQSIIQAIESLSDPQIDDFLSGRLPLTLALRVGDHMMFVQLQLEQSQNSSPDVKSSRTQHSSTSPFSQFPTSESRNVSPRLYVDSSTPRHLDATSVLPKSPVEFEAKKFSSSRTPSGSVTSESTVSGPAPKVPKLSSKVDGTGAAESTRAVHKIPHFRRHRHRHHASPEEVPYAIFDPRFESIQQVTHHYNQIASHINHHAQSGTNHLHRLVTACSSLEQVVAIPPAEPMVPTTVPEHPRKSSRKRPSTLLTPDPNLAPSSSSQANGYPDSVGPTLPAAFIQNALLRHHQLGFPPLPAASLLSSAYAKYQASQGSSSAPQSASSSPVSPPPEIRHKHPITANMLQAASSSKHHGSKSERPHQHKRVSTSGRVTSGSLSHHSSGLSGARVARQMQRLRRLCGSHQQCVAYSNRELATEISSIVHMAKHSHHHHSRSEGSSHRKSHKNCRECHGRARLSSSDSASGKSTSTSGVQATGACIDSFTTHGPGIFSGTFSGSLHPSIQDADGKPKRDPKTILQILTDLLNATHQYQGQLGNVGLLPQLFKDHFKSDSVGATKSISSPAETTADSKNQSSADKPTSSREFSKAQSKQDSEKVHATKVRQVHSTQAYHSHPFLVAQKGSASKIPAPAQYLSSVSTIPIGNIPVSYAPRHLTRSSRRNSPSRHEGGSSSKHHRYHHHSRSHHHYKHHAFEKAGLCCSSSSCRRQAKHQLAMASQKEHENNNTRSKMLELKKKMEHQRHLRQSRRAASKIFNKQRAVEKQRDVGSAKVPSAETVTSSDVMHAGAVKSGKMEVQFDDIKEIKDVTAETVTV